VDGTIWITPGGRGARLSGIRLTTHDPTFTIPLKVQADNAVVSGNSIRGGPVSTNCVLVASYREARGIRIERNRIGHCGRDGKFDHLIYVSHARNAVIRNNVLFDNRGGWAVHLYPDADGSLVERNVMDSNLGGVIFAGDGSGHTSDGNVVRNNAITRSGPRWNIEGSWSGGPEGSGNRAERNCLYDGRRANGGIGELTGFTVSGNTILSRLPYLGRRDYRFSRRSPCAKLVGSVATRAGR
jgi:Right handed beta helix region